jgi:sn-glycerol 3-phosphate transport system substrate-binding protein
MKRIVFALLLLFVGVGVLPAAAQEMIEIEFVHNFGDEQDVRGGAVQAIADAFMAENPNIKVNVSSPSTDYTELFNGALLSAEQGNAPHIVQVEEGLTQLAADSGFFTPISELASEEQLASLEDVMPVVRNYYNIGDVVWSIPWNSSNPLLYYNATMFETVGLDAAPATFEELTAACDTLMAQAEALNIRACINFPMVSWFPEQWVAMQGGLLANNDNGRSARATEMLYTSPELLKVVNWWKALADKDYYTYSGRPNDYNGEAIGFLSKQTAMTINSTAGLTNFLTFSKAQGFELGVAPLPLPDEEATNGGTVGGASLWITSGHPEAEMQAAVDFVFFMTNTENDMAWHKASGYFPNRQSSIEQLTEEGWFDEAPAFKIALDQLAAAKGTIANAGAVIGPSAEVRGVLIEAFQSIIDGGEDPQAALEAAKARADAILADYNALVEG